MASSTQDEEEVQHRKEEDALHKEPDHDQADLNKEAKHEDVDDKIVASESESTSEGDHNKKMEPEVKDANQEDDDTIVVPSTTTSPRSLTQEEEEEEKAREDDLSMRYTVLPKNPSVLEIDDYEEDDSEQTLRFLTRWKAPETPPEKIVNSILVEQCSRPVQKQLTTSDVKEMKLCLSRKKFQQLLDGSGEKKEIRFRVYGPDGNVHKSWLGDVEERSLELTIGWRKFVVDYELKACCDFVTVWMFRHRDTQKICLAVDVTRFAFRKQVSKRISDAAFSRILLIRD